MKTKRRAGSRRRGWALALLVIAAAGCSRPRPLHPNLLLISIDTLRADHLGCYGYQRATSPNIDRLAREGIVFEHTYAPSNWTLPSHASLFTGLYPLEHGVVARSRSLSDGQRLLPEVLAERGYRNAAVVSTVPFLRRRHGFDQGWETYDDHSAYGRGRKWASHRASRAVHEFAVAQLDRFRDDPFFLFLHNFDVHGRYEPPPPFDTMFQSAPAPSELAPRARLSQAERRLLRLSQPADELPETRRERLMALYDGEIRWVDDWIGKLIEELDRRALLDKTVIAVVSDHGEEFLEHGAWHHGQNLFDTSLRVPWIVRLPGAQHAGRRIRTPVSLVDVPATLMALLGVAPASLGTGRDRTPWLATGMPSVGGAPEVEELFSSRRSTAKDATSADSMQAIIAAGFKAIFPADERERPLLPALGLFRLGVDPEELHDLSATEPEQVAALRDRLEAAAIEQLRRQRRLPPGRRNPPSAKERAELRALGYL